MSSSGRASVSNACLAALAALSVTLSSLWPAPAGIRVQDDFSSPQASGWGSPDMGGPYSYSSAEGLRVVDHSGIIAIDQGASARDITYDGAEISDVRVSADVAVREPPRRGRSATLALQARKTDGWSYRATLRTSADGSLYLGTSRIDGTPGKVTELGAEKLSGINAAAGAKISFEFEVTGTDPVKVRARLWTASSARPGWQIVADDPSPNRIRAAGATGLWAYTSAGVNSVRFGVQRFDAVDTAAPVLAPTATPAPWPAPAPALPPALAAAASIAGSLPVGQAAYPYPAGAVFVAPSGSDTARGTIDAPLRTLQQAVRSAPAGGTVVLRGGEYHEFVMPENNKKLIIQNYPGEAAWLDGSEVVTGWTRSGNAWVRSGWNTGFDASPTYRRGAADNTAAGWSFINAAYPMASHPDQVWFGGARQKQVGSRSALTAGTFYVDTVGKRLYVGSDPASQEVRASTLNKAISLRADGSVLRGVGVRRYAPSVPDMGAIEVSRLATNGLVENVVTTDNATTGLTVGAANVNLRKVTSTNNGFLGIHTAYADHLVADGVRVTNNNTEHFNQIPAAGGYKITRSRDVTVTNSAFLNNDGTGLWMDESVYDMAVVNNVISGNGRHGLVVELSDTAVLANNLVSRNARTAIYLINTGHVSIWNNTVTGNRNGIWVAQDQRTATNRDTAGHDPRQVSPDPTMPWISQDIRISNNIVAAGPGPAGQLLVVADQTRKKTGQQMGVVANGNLYQQSSAAFQPWPFSWATGEAGSKHYGDFTSYRQDTGQDAGSRLLTGAEVLAAAGGVLDVDSPATPSVALQIPAHVRALTGLPAGPRLGAAANGR